MLHNNVSMHDRQEGGSLLPQGVLGVALEGHHKSEGKKAATEADVAISDDRWKDEEVAYAMYAGITEAEALEPCIINEVQKQLDCLCWDEVIKAELKSLNDAHTWDIIP